MVSAAAPLAGMLARIPMPALYLELRALLANPETAIEDFVELVERDEALADRVMRMASSRYFGYPRPSASLYQAISLLGLMQLHDLALAHLSMRALATMPLPAIEWDDFWRGSVERGIAARTIGCCIRAEAERAYFTLGLLHRVGQLALAGQAHRRAPAGHQVEPDVGVEAAAEASRFSDYGTVGATLMRAWQWPPVFPQVAAFQRNPQAADAEYRVEVEAVHLAEAYCHSTSADARAAAIRSSGRRLARFERILPTEVGRLIGEEIADHSDAVLDLYRFDRPQGPPDGGPGDPA